MSRILVKGDVSGIQSFIFNVNSKGAARSLKGRSFFIKILLEIVMQKVFDSYSMDSAEEEKAKISTSGGNFILQLNETEENKIDALQFEISKSLQYVGLNFMLVAVPWDGMDETYQTALEALHQKTRERKFNLLINYDHFFQSFDRLEISDVNGLPNKKGDNSKWPKITDALKSNSALIITKDKDAQSQFLIRGSQIQLLGYTVKFGEEGIPVSDYLESVFPIKQKGTYKGNDNLIKFEELSDGKYKNKYYDKRDRNSKSWIFIRNRNRGIDKLGILAMDVDNLGKAVENVASPEAHKRFDAQLQRFFNLELSGIISQKFKNQVYTVTAGGDDSFFVGKWNTMLELAIAINDAFNKEFEHQGLTISAGLVIVHPKFPVVRFAQMAEEALKKAKYTYAKKGNISLFGEILDWGVCKDEIQNLRADFNRSGRKLISAGLLAKARHTAIHIAEDKGIRLSDFWKMSYYMRELKGESHGELIKKHQGFLAKSSTETDKKIKRNYRLVFPIAARLAELDNR